MGRKTTDHRNIVIVCEGNDTEFNYFTDVKKHLKDNYPNKYEDIKVVPIKSEIIKDKNPNRKSRGKIHQDDSPSFHYWCLEEHSEEEYNKYCKQPTRYVREAELYMLDEGYLEACAVFDKDIHADHVFAFEHASSIPNMHIAFSSYSFEEWILAHFERNPTAFIHSDCKDKDQHYLYCGTQRHKDDCHGTKCIAGYIRENKWIKDYDKKQNNIFSNYTLPLMKKAMINAAWTRTLATDDIYYRNPYTNVDMFLAYLFDMDTYQWHYHNDSIKYGGSRLQIAVAGDRISITNIGKNTVLLKASDFFFIDDNYDDICMIFNQNILLPPLSMTFQTKFGSCYIRLKQNGVNHIIDMN